MATPEVDPYAGLIAFSEDWTPEQITEFQERWEQRWNEAADSGWPQLTADEEATSGNRA